MHIGYISTADTDQVKYQAGGNIRDECNGILIGNEFV